MSLEMVPFGKHKGKPVDALLDDRPYLDWLLAQPWFKEKFGNVYNIVINNGNEPSETPEHNAMQIRFLEEEYRLKFAYLARPDGFLYAVAGGLSQWNEQIRVIQDSIIEGARKRNAHHRAQYLENQEIERRERAARQKVPIVPPMRTPSHEWSLPAGPFQESEEPAPISCSGMQIPLPDGRLEKSDDLTIWVSPPAFESDGADVRFHLRCGFEIQPQQLDTGERSYIYSTHVDLPKPFIKSNFIIEIKPSVGDDYPAVLRQVKRNGANYLLTKSYCGVGASQPQFCDFFQTQGVKVIFESDVDSIVIPPLIRKVSDLEWMWR